MNNYTYLGRVKMRQKAKHWPGQRWVKAEHWQRRKKDEHWLWKRWVKAEHWQRRTIDEHWPGQRWVNAEYWQRRVIDEHWPGQRWVNAEYWQRRVIEEDSADISLLKGFQFLEKCRKIPLTRAVLSHNKFRYGLNNKKKWNSNVS